MKIGLLMIRDENDILEDSLASNCELLDGFYVLDGSGDFATSAAICYATGKCRGYTRDADLGGAIIDGHRQVLYQQATEDFGFDHWFLILHGDELWTFDPDEVIAEHPGADGFEFHLPFAFPRSWDPDKSAHEQLTEFMIPGWPEFRMFRGAPDVYFTPERHFCTTPYGLKKVVRVPDRPILHYLYRSPEVQYERAAKRAEWSPENWQELPSKGPFWDDERIAAFCARSEHYTHAEILVGI